MSRKEKLDFVVNCFSDERTKINEKKFPFPLRHYYYHFSLHLTQFSLYEKKILHFPDHQDLVIMKPKKHNRPVQPTDQTTGLGAQLMCT